MIACAAAWTALAATTPASAHAPSVVLRAYGSATVDGRLAAGEWERAAVGTFETDTPVGPKTATVRFMNDRRLLYFALTLGVPSFAFSRVSLTFDSNHDGVPTSGTDDLLQLDHGVATATDTLLQSDEYYCGSPTQFASCFDRRDGGADQQRGAIGADAAEVTYEISKPLVGDMHDLNVSAGDAVGFLVTWDMIDPPAAPSRRYWRAFWPAGWYDEMGRFGDLVVSAPPPPERLRVSFAPPLPRAGRPFRVGSVEIVRQGGLVERPDKTSCTARLGRRTLRPRSACSWLIPPRTSRTRLSVTVTAAAGDDSVTVKRSLTVR